MDVTTLRQCPFTHHVSNLPLTQYSLQAIRVYLTNTNSHAWNPTPVTHILITLSHLPPLNIVFQHNFHLLIQVLFVFSASSASQPPMISMQILANANCCVVNSDHQSYPNCFCSLFFGLMKLHWSCFIICQLKFLMLLSSSEMHYLCILPHLNFPMPSSIYMSLCSLNTISFRIVYIHPQFELFSFSSEFSSHFFFTSFYLYFYLVVVLFVCILPTCLG